MIKNYGEMNLFIYSWRHGTLLESFLFLRFILQRDSTHIRASRSREKGRGRGRSRLPAEWEA